MNRGCQSRNRGQGAIVQNIIIMAHGSDLGGIIDYTSEKEQHSLSYTKPRLLSNLGPLSAA